MSKPIRMGGPMVWSLLLRQNFAQPVVAMRLLRVAECGARTRAKLAVDTWRDTPEQVLAALGTLRSAPAILAGLKHMGWDETTPDPTGGIAHLLSLASGPFREQ